MKPAVGTFKLTLSIVLVDIFILLIFSAIAPFLYNTADWMSEWVGLTLLVLGYRYASLQPLCLYVILKLARQKLESFSPVRVMIFSSISSFLSLYLIGILFSIFTGAYAAEILVHAGVFFKNILAGMRHSWIIPALSGVLMTSPWIVLCVRRFLWTRRV